jgi:hypothetical protein
MKRRFLKLTGGQNIRLATISSRLAVLCGNYLLEGPTATSDEDLFILKKGRDYFEDVRKGLDIENKSHGLSFDPETLHSINAYKEVFLVAKNEMDVNKVLEDVDETFNVLEGKKTEVDDEILKEFFDFFTKLAEKVRVNDSYPEASHTL